MACMVLIYATEDGRSTCHGPMSPQEVEVGRYTLLSSSPGREVMLYMVVRHSLVKKVSVWKQQLRFMQVVTGLEHAC